MISILTWISLITGGILILLMLLSLIGGLDFDMDIGNAEVETDSGGGGIGLLKGSLTFISVTSWVIKLLLATNQHPMIAIGIGLFAGAIAFFLLNYLFKLLLKNEENVNWAIEDALFREAKVYLRIPPKEGTGIIQVTVKGATRELKAKTNYHKLISTGDHVIITEVNPEYVVVEPVKRNGF